MLIPVPLALRAERGEFVRGPRLRSLHQNPWESSGWHRGEKICVTRQYPLAILLPEDGQRVSLACNWLGVSRWSYDDGEPAPHERPVAQDFDFLNLARAVELRRIGGSLSVRRCSEIGLAHDRLSRHEKDCVV